MVSQSADSPFESLQSVIQLQISAAELAKQIASMRAVLVESVAQMSTNAGSATESLIRIAASSASPQEMASRISNSVDAAMERLAKLTVTAASRGEYVTAVSSEGRTAIFESMLGVIKQAAASYEFAARMSRATGAPTESIEQVVAALNSAHETVIGVTQASGTTRSENTRRIMASAWAVQESLAALLSSRRSNVEWVESLIRFADSRFEHLISISETLTVNLEIHTLPLDVLVIAALLIAPYVTLSSIGALAGMVVDSGGVGAAMKIEDVTVETFEAPSITTDSAVMTVEDIVIEPGDK